LPDYRHDPIINYGANLLKQAGGEEYTLGRNTATQGIENLQPVYDYFKKALSGDTTELAKLIQPETDIIGQQFDQVRSMIADQPRSGGKASTLAELPVEQIRAISNLMQQARTGAAGGAAGVAGAQTQAGLGLAGQGLSAAGQAANIAMGGRAQDIGSSFRANFLSNLGSTLGQSIGNLLI